MKKLLFTSAVLMSMLAGAANAEDNALTDQEVKDGFKLLFDGSTLTSFSANFVDYIKNNATNTGLDAKWKVDATCKCINLTSGNAPDARTKTMYKDFDLRLSYRIDNNEGIFYRARLTGDKAWETGVEYAINNVTNLGKDNPGAAYDLYAPNPLPYNQFNTGKWNTARIVVKGDSVEHWMNEAKVVGYRYHTPAFWAAYNASKWNSESRLTTKVAGDRNGGYIEEGYIGLQADHGGKWIIKDLKLSTAPCFGAVNQYGSSCGTVPTGIGDGSNLVPRIAFTTVSQVAGNLNVTFDRQDVKGASVLGLDGKVLSRASLADGGRKAVFAGALKPGLYFLRLDLVSGSVSQKLNLL